MNSLESSLGIRSLNDRPTGKDLLPINLFCPSLISLCLSLKNILQIIGWFVHQELGNGHTSNGPAQCPFLISLSIEVKAIFSSSGLNLLEKSVFESPRSLPSWPLVLPQRKILL